MSAPEIFGLILSIYPILYMSIFLHELGHVIAGRAAGFTVTSFGLGTARPWCVVTVRGATLYLALVRPFQGITFAYYPQLDSTRGQMAGFSAGGILVNGLIAAIALALWRASAWGGAYWLVVAAVNGLLGGTSLIPLRFKVGKAILRTDGALILQALRSATFETSAPMFFQTLDYLRSLWLAVGDTAILRAYLFSAASMWASLGEHERADALLAEAEALPGTVPPDLLALGALARAEVALGAGRLDDAEAALNDAEAIFRANDRPAGLRLAAVLRAQVELGRGNAAGAIVTLDAIAADPLAKGHPGLERILLASRLSAAVAGDDAGEVAALSARYEADRRRRDPATRDLRVDWNVARFHDRRGDRAAAETAFRHALKTIGALADAWTDAAERARFLDRQSVLIEEARQCLQAVGKGDEAERLIHGFSKSAAPAAEVDQETDRKRRRWGIRLMFLNLISGIASAGLSATLDHGNAQAALIVLALILGLFMVAGALYLGLDVVTSRFAPGLLRRRGAVLLILACCPWICMALVLLMILLDPHE